MEGAVLDTQNKILVVDDQEETTDCLVRSISHAYPQYEVSGVTDGLQALQWLQEYSPEMVITDLRMPKYGGLEVIMETLAQNPKTPVIAMSAMGLLEEVRIVAKRFTSLRMLAKPFMMGELFDTMDAMLNCQPESFAQGFQPISMLQVVHLENRTCRMELTEGDVCGELCFDKGELKFARASGAMGEDALFTILKMRNPMIKLYKGNHGYPQNVRVALEGLLLEYCRRCDEMIPV